MQRLMTLAVNFAFGMLMFLMGLRFLSGVPILPEWGETIEMWARVLGP